MCIRDSSWTVSLQDRSIGEEAFQIFVSTANPPAGSPVQYPSVVGSSGTTKNYTFTGLLRGTTYYLRARGWNAADSIDGAYSNLISTTIPFSDFTYKENAPVLSVVNVTTSSLTVSLHDRSIGEEAFYFFLSRTSPSGGDPIQYPSVVRSSGTTKNYTFTGLLHGTVYYVVARGYNCLLYTSRCV